MAKFFSHIFVMKRIFQVQGNMKMLSFKCIEAGLVLLKSYLMTIINFVTCLSISQQRDMLSELNCDYV